RREVGERVIDAVVVDPLDQSLAYLRYGAAGRAEVLVDDSVVHRREATVGEAGRQILRRVQLGRVRRVRHAEERRDDQAAPAEQVDGYVDGRELAADEQRVPDVHSG